MEETIKPICGETEPPLVKMDPPYKDSICEMPIGHDGDHFDVYNRHVWKRANERANSNQ